MASGAPLKIAPVLAPVNDARPVRLATSLRHCV
jgi:hypothetical protein